tara:strand:- start:5207 stop:5362 length:156 start_codon:yes stop_codon:yes gene_type:complete
MKIFLSLMVVWCSATAAYYYLAEPEQTSTIVFWSMLTLFNNQNLIAIRKNG